MSETSDRRLYFPHVARNREPILEILQRVLPRQGLVLEIASGGGEHAAYFASNLPGLRWQPTDANSEMFESIAAHRAAIGVANLLLPLHLDVTSEQWPVERADAMVCCNMIHIAPWVATEGLIAGAGRTLTARRSPLSLRPLQDRRSSHGAEQSGFRRPIARAKPAVGRARSHRGIAPRGAPWFGACRNRADAGQQSQRHFSSRIANESTPHAGTLDGQCSV